MNGALDVNVHIARGAFKLAAEFSCCAGAITALFGPSAAGKSLLLSAIAGLVKPDAGAMRLDGAALTEPAWRRGIGAVFQEARLFPHLNVRGNLNYAAKRAPGVPPNIEEAAGQTGCLHFLERGVAQLSGGERNRVALARALLSKPRLLLLDEPFAALDSAARQEFLALLREIHMRTSLAMLIVSHQIDDAASLADHMVVLRAGETLASGEIDSASVNAALRGVLDPKEAGAALAAQALTRAETHAGAHVWVRADHVLLATQQPIGLSARNIWAGQVSSLVAEKAGSVLAEVQTDVGQVFSRITPQASEELSLGVGKQVWAIIKAHAV